MSINLFESSILVSINQEIVKVIADALVGGLRKAHDAYQDCIFENSLTRSANDFASNYIYQSLNESRKSILPIKVEKESNNKGYDYPLILDFSLPKPIAILVLSEGSFYDIKNDSKDSTHYAKVACTANSKIGVRRECEGQLCMLEKEQIEPHNEDLYITEQYRNMISKLGVSIDKTILFIFKRNRNKVSSLKGCLVDTEFNIIQEYDYTKYLPIHNFEEASLPNDRIVLPDNATVLDNNISNVTPKILIKEKE